MLAGKPPFNGKNDTDIQAKIKVSQYKTRQRDFKNISPEAMNFLKRLMSIDANDRPTAYQALQDPWIKNIEQDRMILHYKNISEEGSSENKNVQLPHV